MTAKAACGSSQARAVSWAEGVTATDTTAERLMQPIVIPCPHCGSQLKLRDPALLGKIGKCPQCQSRFPLADPAVVELELADEPAGPAADPPQPPGDVDPVGTGIQIVVDEPPPAVEMLRRRQRTSGSRWLLPAATLAAFVLVGLGLWWALAPAAEPRTAAPAPIAAEPAAVPPVEAPPAAALPAVPPVASGPAIDLMHVPHGAGMVLNLRPAELWSATGGNTRILDCLGGDFEAWAAAELKRHCLFEPSSIAEAKLCYYFAAPGEPVQVAGVVTLTDPRKPSEMIALFGGERQTDLPRPYYVGNTTSFLMVDERTFAFCPSSMVGDWQDTFNGPAISRDNILRILQSTDRLDQITVVVEPTDLRLHCETLTSPDVYHLVRPVLDWLGDDVATVGWGLRWGPSFRSRAILAARTTFEQGRLQRGMNTKIQEVPQQILALVSEFEPATLGTKRLLGRFPAMSLAAQRATRVTGDGMQTVVETLLPAIAGPNLLLATRLAWHEALHPASVAGAVGTAAVTEPDRPALSIAQRLAQPIDCDFRRTPLHEALAYVGTETGVEFELMGDDLKLIGVTQNMPQEFALEQSPATVILDRMLTKDGMVVVVDEQNNRAVVTSAKAAAERGQTPFRLTTDAAEAP